MISDGMAVKVKAALHAAETLGKPVCVASWRYPDQLLKLLAGGAVGTIVTSAVGTGVPSDLHRNKEHPMQHLLKDSDLNKAQIEALIALGKAVKADPRSTARRWPARAW